MTRVSMPPTRISGLELVRRDEERVWPMFGGLLGLDRSILSYRATRESNQRDSSPTPLQASRLLLSTATVDLWRHHVNSLALPPLLNISMPHPHFEVSLVIERRVAL